MTKNEEVQLARLDLELEELKINLRRMDVRQLECHEEIERLDINKKAISQNIVEKIDHIENVRKTIEKNSSNSENNKKD